jgi:hypothetical protein
MITVESLYGPNKNGESNYPRNSTLFVAVGQQAVVSTEVRIAGIPTQAGFFVAVAEDNGLYRVGKLPFEPDRPGSRRRELMAQPLDAHPWRMATGNRPALVSSENFVLLGPSLVADDVYVTHGAGEYTDRLDVSMTDHYGYLAMTPDQQDRKLGMSLEVVMPLSTYLGASIVRVEAQPITASKF